MMKPYTKKYYPMLLEWTAARNLPHIPMWALSDTGIIEPGIAAGFLYVTNSDIGVLDHYITNPDIPKFDRNKALFEITRGLMSLAKNEYNIKRLVATTEYNSIKELALHFGFVDTGSLMNFSKEI